MTTSVDALVLWIEMLGYRGWLRRQTNLEQAEADLLAAIELVYRSPDGMETKLRRLGIHAMLISDTIVVWTNDWNLDAWLALHVSYHVLATRLALLGLPVRGALAIGSLRIRNREPRTVLGQSIVYCASLERTIKAFVVVADDSVLQMIGKLGIDQGMPYRSTLSLLRIATSAGYKNLFVLNWMIAAVPHALHVAYRRLYARYAEGDREAILDLMAFLPKFLNSRQMIQTLTLRDELNEQAEREWADSILHAERNWDFVFERGRQEVEEMTKGQA